MHNIPVVIIDAHPLMRRGMEHLVAAESRLSLQGEASSLEMAVDLCQRVQPRLILVGVPTLDQAGLDTVRCLRALCAQAKIVVLCERELDDDLVCCAQAGADACLGKSTPLDQLMHCINTLLDGRPFATAAQAFRFANRQRAIYLTPRERDILDRLVTGMSNKLIADSAGIGVGTVKFHIKRIMGKLDAHTRTEVAMRAAKQGLVTLN